jgi:hypothetical protein
MKPCLKTEIRAGRKQLVLFLNTLPINNTPPLATYRPQRLWEESYAADM